MQVDFIKVVKENKGIIYKVTKIYTNTYEDQQDLYQEILYQLWKSFESFNYHSKMSTWIYRVALNTSLSFLNKQKNILNALIFNRLYIWLKTKIPF